MHAAVAARRFLRFSPLVVAPAAALTLILLLAPPTHANAPAGRYVMAVPSDGTVYDTKTKLTWQQAVSAPLSWGDAATPATAQSYCATLSLGAVPGGWRLPTVGELQTLVDYSKTGLEDGGAPAAMIDSTYFPGTPPNVFWSATPFAGYAGFAWGVNFTFGNSNGYDEAPANFVRCVR